MTSTDTAQLRELIVDLVTNSSRFVRLAVALADNAYPPAALRALSVLEEHGEIRITELAEIDRSSQPSATALVKKLEALGLVQRRRDPRDSRAVLIASTGAGRRALGESRTAIGDALAPRFAGIDPDRIARIAQGLAELRDVLKESDI